MTRCPIQEDGVIELYFYGDLEPDTHATVAAHLAGCQDCALALQELGLIRAALSGRPDVAAPRSGDWSGFMARLDAAVRATPPAQVATFRQRAVPAHRGWIGLLATAALLALVAISVFMASRAGRSALGGRGELEPAQVVASAGETAADPSMRAALTSVGMHHLERSKLVVLGLAAKEATGGTVSEWAYERELAGALLNDTRLYRQAAEQRGLLSLARVMRDLELVLLQTSMAEATDGTALPQIQRLIQKRGLVEKMDVVTTTGLLP